MFPAPFFYHKPESVDEAIKLLGELGEDTKLLAGGHSLLPSMKLRLIQPKHLIDIGSISELKGIAADDRFITIGAGTTHYEIESSDRVKSELHLLSEVAGVIADPQVRNRGTIGGSLSNSDPAADWPATAAALRAEFVCKSASGERTVAASDWFQGLFSTALEESEILCAVRFEKLPARTAAVYLKMTHPASRFAVVGVSAAVTTDKSGECIRARVGITGVGTHACAAAETEKALRGKRFDSESISAAAALSDDGLDIGADMHFSEQTKQKLCRAYVKRALHVVLERTRLSQFQGSS